MAVLSISVSLLHRIMIASHVWGVLEYPQNDPPIEIIELLSLSSYGLSKIQNRREQNGSTCLFYYTIVAFLLNLHRFPFVLRHEKVLNATKDLRRRLVTASPENNNTHRLLTLKGTISQVGHPQYAFSTSRTLSRLT
jgi:hypothetical protein